MANFIDEIQINNVNYQVTLNSGITSNGLNVDSNGKISVKLGHGLKFDNGAITMSTEYVSKTDFDNLSGNVITDLSTYVGNGLKFDNDKINVNVSTGLTVNENQVELDYPVLKTMNSNFIKPYNGITVDNNGVGVKAGNGITVDSNGVSVKLGNGITFNDLEIYVENGYLRVRSEVTDAPTTGPI